MFVNTHYIPTIIPTKWLVWLLVLSQQHVGLSENRMLQNPISIGLSWNTTFSVTPNCHIRHIPHYIH
jgi:hypothetical protein